MKIVAISDTHEYHRKLDMPDGDVLIHAGDFTMMGDKWAIEDFNDWLGGLPYRHKIAIYGNHDLTLDPDHEGYREGYDKLLTNCTVLNDSGCEIDGFKIWGSPIQPWFHNWAFNRQRGSEIDEHWQLIPANVDVLITHGPPFGILDQPFGNQPSVGCERLLTHLHERISPKLHIFGHIHGSAGKVPSPKTFYINASVVNELYKVANQPSAYEISKFQIELSPAATESQLTEQPPQ